jgi:hypothetical protein
VGREKIVGDCRKIDPVSLIFTGTLQDFACEYLPESGSLRDGNEHQEQNIDFWWMGKKSFPQKRLGKRLATLMIGKESFSSPTECFRF